MNKDCYIFAIEGYPLNFAKNTLGSRAQSARAVE